MLNEIIVSSLLFIGDSHSVGPFGQKLDSELRTLGVPVTTATSCGTIAANWYRSGAETTCGYLERDASGRTRQGTRGAVPQFTTLLQDVAPSHVIVALATNYANFPDENFIVSDMRRMAQDIVNSGAKCFWVGMPTSRKLASKHTKIDRLTRNAVSDLCTYFDSFPVTTYPATGGDGIHFYFPGGPAVAQNWALKVFEAFTTTEQ
jgi:hypothetical protein